MSFSKTNLQVQYIYPEIDLFMCNLWDKHFYKNTCRVPCYKSIVSELYANESY